MKWLLALMHECQDGVKVNDWKVKSEWFEHRLKLGAIDFDWNLSSFIEIYLCNAKWIIIFRLKFELFFDLKLVAHCERKVWLQSEIPWRMGKVKCLV